MTVMKHKSVDARRTRRTRLKRAMKPVMELFGCTQMEVSGLVESTYRDNERLKQEVANLTAKVTELKAELKQSEENCQFLKKRLADAGS